MNEKQIMKIFEDTAYVRTGGTKEELACAEYIKKYCEDMGLNASLEFFDVQMGDVKEAHLIADGKEIPCIGYMNCGSGEVEAPLYYLTNTDPHSLSLCKDKIVLIDVYLNNWLYHDIMENGALGIISYSGNANFDDNDIDARELRPHIARGEKMLAVNINVKDAVKIVEDKVQTVKISVAQDEYVGKSQNVVVELKGDIDEYIVLTAHYDSTSLSQGAYDNMSGSVGLLIMAKHFASKPHKYGLRFVWCGSEERGLLGSKAYCIAHEDELQKIALNVNLDMIGCIMGKFIAVCTCEEAMVNYIKYFAMEKGFGMAARQGVYSSDSTPFADKGVPALSFARDAAGNVHPIHNRFDTMAVMNGERMISDTQFIEEFVSRMANAAKCPVSREIPENMKEKLDNYMLRKRPKQ